MKRIVVLLTVLSLSAPAAWASGKRAIDDAKLRQAVQWMKTADGYACTMTTHSESVSDKAQQQTFAIHCYSSRANAIQYAGTEAYVFFMDKRGMFKADAARKQAICTTFSSDSAWQKAMESAPALAGSLDAMDSAFFSNAVLKSVKQARGETIYSLSYPAGSPLTSSEITFNTRTAVVSSLSYHLRRSVDGSGRKGTYVIQQITINGFEHSIPEAVKAIMKQDSDLPAYLQATYPSYKITQRH